MDDDGRTGKDRSDAERIVVAITGASGTVYGIRALEMLREAGIETHLVVSHGGHLTREHETDLSRAELESLASVVHRPSEIGASIASGSFLSRGMLIAPCSMRTLGEIASGVTSSLVTRAADVALKERRRLVLLARESPLTSIHLRNMATVTEAGGIVMPPVPAFYTRPATLEEMVDQTVGRALDLFGIRHPQLSRWGGDVTPRGTLRRSRPRP